MHNYVHVPVSVYVKKLDGIAEREEQVLEAVGGRNEIITGEAAGRPQGRRMLENARGKPTPFVCQLQNQSEYKRSSTSLYLVFIFF